MADVDHDLVRRLQAQDPLAFVELVGLYRSRVFAYALRILRDHQDAEEVTNDVLLVVWRKIGQFRGDAKLLSWLLCITRNRALHRFSFLLRRGRRSTVSMDAEHGEVGGPERTLADLCVAEEPSVPRRAELAEFQAQITVIFPKLNARERQIMTLCLEGKTYQEMSDLTGIGFGTVKSRLARARLKLRALLEDRDPALCDLQPERVA